MPLFWPGPKCDWCPGAIYCPRATAPAREFAADPRGFIADLSALRASLAARLKTLRNVVDESGDVVLPDGTWLCTFTTGAGREGSGGQHIVVPMLDASLAFFWSDGMIGHTFQGEDTPCLDGVCVGAIVNCCEDGDDVGPRVLERGPHDPFHTRSRGNRLTHRSFGGGPGGLDPAHPRV